MDSLHEVTVVKSDGRPGSLELCILRCNERITNPASRNQIQHCGKIKMSGIHNYFTSLQDISLNKRNVTALDTLELLMKRNLLIVIVLLILAASERPSHAEAGITLYVTLQVNDVWSGRIDAPSADRKDGPLASLMAARNRIRAIRQAGVAAPARVIIGPGLYRMREPLTLQPQDSNTQYLAEPGAHPVFSGGLPISGWKPGPGKLWSAKIPASAQGNWYFQQLFVNGDRRTRARTEGWFHVVHKGVSVANPQANTLPAERTSFYYAPGELKEWPDIADAQVVIYHSWETSRLRVASIDTSQHLVTFTGPSNWPFQDWERSQRYYVENIREGLNKPGEWYLDRKAGELLYYPKLGEDMRHVQVTAPVLTRLVTLEGQPSQAGSKPKYVRGVTIKGLSFQHEDWVFEPQGHSDTQAAFSCPAAVMADWALDCGFVDCEIAHVGDYGLWWRRGCCNSSTIRCRLHDLGVGGVRIGEATEAVEDIAESRNCVIDNCHIYDGGHVYPAGVGVWIAQSSHNLVSHNEIHDLNYSGMSIGWNWGDEPNRCHDNIIEFNHIHHVVRGQMSDSGAIYTLGASHGSIIRNNLLHDIFAYNEPPFGWGIYLDATTSGYLVENNVVYNTLTGDLMCSNGGHENVIRNNIFAATARYMLWPFWAEEANTFEHNIISMTQGELIVGLSEPSLLARLAANDRFKSWNRNLYQIPKGATFLRRNFTDWQNLGLDRDSILANPLFVDAKNGDYRLKPGSPAFKLGFQAIDLRFVGLYGSPAWVAEGRAAHYPPTVLPKPPVPPGPVQVEDDFESTPVGAAPELAHVIGEEKSASIRVTDERAASGKHSLKVTDAPGLTNAWDPHFYYEPHFTAGTVTESFDILLQPKCLIFTEWRDSTGYPQCIGPSLVMDGDGHMGTGARELTTVRVGVWVHVIIQARVGASEPKEWSVSIQPRGEQARLFDHLPIPGASFNAVHWLGFSSTATVAASCFIDNVRITVRK